MENNLLHWQNSDVQKIFLNTDIMLQTSEETKGRKYLEAGKRTFEMRRHVLSKEVLKSYYIENYFGTKLATVCGLTMFTQNVLKSMVNL